jgi:hypothetical protein
MARSSKITAACASATQDARAQLRTTTDALDDALRKIASAPAKKGLFGRK